MNKINYDDMPELIDPKVAAGYLGMSVQFVYRQIKKGHIPARKLGNKIRIRKEDLCKIL